MYVILNQVIYFKYKLSGLYVGSNTINKYKKQYKQAVHMFWFRSNWAETPQLFSL